MEQHYGGAADVADYTCYRVREPLPLDGRLDAAAGAQAPRSPRFVDVVTGRPGLYDTRAAALWDDEALYIGFWLEEPFVAAELTERDSLIFYENDIEVFIDGGDCYYEFEMNALGTIYEVFLIWQDAYRRGGRFDVPEFDLLDRPALSFGGNFDRVGADRCGGARIRAAPAGPSPTGISPASARRSRSTARSTIRRPSIAAGGSSWPSPGRGWGCSPMGAPCRRTMAIPGGSSSRATRS